MRITAVVLILTILSVGVDPAFAHQDGPALTQSAKVDEATAWLRVAEAIPLGSKVKLQLADGRRFSGTLMRVDGNTVMLKRNTRRPEPALTVAFSDVAKLERDQPGGGTQIAKAIGVGLAAGAGVFFSLVLIALQLD